MRATLLMTGTLFLFSVDVAEAQTPPPAPAPAVHRSKGMTIAGIVLTSFAATALVTGVGLLVCCKLGDSDGVYDRTAAGLLTVVFSNVPAAVGIPLWVVGAGPPSPHPATSWSPLAPAVGVGARSAALRWTF